MTSPRRTFVTRAIVTLGLTMSTRGSFACWQAVTIPSRSVTRLWSVDLDTDRDFVKRSEVEEVLLDKPSVYFLDGKHILLGFYDRVIGYNPTFAHHTFYVNEINAEDGSPGKKMQFDSVDDHAAVLPAADGFAVLADEKLTRYNSQFVALAEFPTSTRLHDGRPTQWLVDAAPSGHVLLLYNHLGGDLQANWVWLRSDDLKVIRNQKADLTLSFQATDDAAVFENNLDRNVLNAGATKHFCEKCSTFILTSDLVFVDKFPASPFLRHKYIIESIEGKPKSSGSLSDTPGDLTRAAGSPRLAYLAGHYTGASSLSIEKDYKGLSIRIVVLDWERNKQIARLDLAEAISNPSAGAAQSALALSPDGSRLLVLFHHTLTCYLLPLI
jgi:hypothetical protein